MRKPFVPRVTNFFAAAAACAGPASLASLLWLCAWTSGADVAPVQAPTPAWAGVGPARVGGPAPAVVASTADGNSVNPEHLRGKTVLLTFWSLADKKYRRNADRLAEVRREFAAEPDFLMLSVHVVRDVRSDNDDWMAFLDERGTASYGEGRPVRFDSDSRWWPAIETGFEEDNAEIREAWGVYDTPRSFLVDGGGTVVAAGLPVRGLRRAVARHFAARAKTGDPTGARGGCGERAN